MAKPRLTVLLKPDQADRLEKYCELSGHKKSTLVARLIREFLDRTERPNDEKRPPP